ncbi:MAG: hypothetical protein JWL96_4571 [Sphingomonas bacterium]|uniref:hypothetical protein n=1 Tax=Sphingomonas bacterium TaxID=1895847 RepID=UPI00261DDD00|nr:hypothetical protein [Sphingomonas bacterium]MDB5712501.1 hypothetical protein [Sphingomonas bacterium]
MTKMTRFGITAACIALVAGASLTLPASARTLVLAASGPSAARFPPGKLLAEPLSLALQRGDMLKLLDGRGVRILAGPATIRERQTRLAPAPVRLGILGLLSTQQRTQRGAVRGGDDAAPAAATPDELWSVDANQPGDWCVPDLRNVRLWRADSSESVALTVTPDRGTVVSARWQSGEHALSWPMTATDRTRYTLRRGSTADLQFTLHRIAVQNDLLALARTLKANHCDVQLAALAGVSS